MTQEEKDLLLKDLCARLPYVVFIGNKKWNRKPYQLTCDEIQYMMMSDDYEDVPYLRPMSSMTEGEQKILEDFGATISATISPFSGQIHVPFDEIEFPFITMQKIISYLYSIHIDINGMIPKGLAIEVTEDNNPYKD